MYTIANASTLSIVITGTETKTDLVLDSILTPTTSYSTAKTITQLSGRLYMANLTADPLPDLQSMAMGIRIDYTTQLVNVISNTNSYKDNLPPGFMPGEVYAFYLGVELNQGGWVAYHIPGRPAYSGEGVNDDRSGALGIPAKLYQLEDTTDRNPAAATNMGYWANENETYPNNAVYGSDAGGLVRHHRFPTLNKLITTYYSSDATVGITTLPRLGINVSNVNLSLIHI